MSLPAAQKEAQATELLRVGCLSDVRAELLRYATKLAGGCTDTANDYYQQALLDGHDAVQRNGFAGTRSQDYKFYLVACIKSQHADERARRAGLAPLPVHYEAAEQLPGPGPAHLAEQVAKEIEQHPDRLLLRLHADGHSSRQIEQLTGHNYRTVLRRVAGLVAELRETFDQAWGSLE